MNEELKIKSGPIVVGIAGGSASGKSTLAASLCAALETSMPAVPVYSMPMDHYYRRDMTVGPFFTSPSTGQIQFDFNHPDSTDNARLLADLDALKDFANVPDVVVIDGLMALAVPALRERLDLKIFVDLDPDLRALRRLLRDMRGGRANSDPEYIATYYIESARVGHRVFVEPSKKYADFIVPGDGDFQQTAAHLSLIIKSLAAATASE